MLEKEPLVSVVTPFYNTDKYLAECIESVLAQTYQNWEYILVNNCSTDQSAKIAQSYAEKDQRVRFIHNKNFLTQVQNYNHALRQISPESKYCKIVQADDWIFPECISKMVDLAEVNASVGIVGAYRLLGRRIENDGLPYVSKIISGKEVCREQILNNRDYFGSPSSILLRSEIVNNRCPFYNENHLYEDTEACFEIMDEWDFGFVHQVLIFERTQDDSLSAYILKFDEDWFLGRFIKIKKYGPMCLNNKEFQQSLLNAKDIYFSFLARKVFCKRNEDFWEYHKKGLATIDVKFSKLMLTKYIIFELLDICLNLDKTVRRLYNKLKLLRSS